MAADILQSLLDAVEGTNTTLTSNTQKIQELSKQQDAAGEALKNAVLNGGQAPLVNGRPQTSGVINQTEAAGRSEQDANAISAKNLGVNSADPNAAINQLQQTEGAMAVKTAAAATALQSAQSVKFLDSPLQYIVNQFKLPGLQDDLDTASTATDVIHKAITGLQEDQTQQGRVNNNLKTLYTDATAASVANAASAATAGQAAEIDMKNIGSNMKTLFDLSNMNEDQVRNYVMGEDAVNRAGSLRVEQQKLSLMMDDRDMAEKAAQMVQLGARSLGVELPDNMLNPKMVAAGIRSNNSTFSTFFNAGIDSLSTGGRSVYGTTPAQSAQNIIGLKLPGQPAQSQVVDLFNSSARLAASGGLTKGGLDPANPKQLPVIVGNLVNNSAKRYLNEINPTDGSNIYNFTGKLKNLGSGGVDTANDPFFKMAVDAQVPSLDFNQLTKLGAQYVGSGKLTVEQVATGLSRMANSAMALNNASKQYEGFGLPRQQAYKSPITEQRMGFSSSRVYDWSKRSEATQALMMQLRDVQDTKELNAIRNGQ